MAPLALATGARALLERSEEPCLGPFLAEWPEAPECFRDCEPGGLPVLRWLRDAVPSAVPGTDALVRLLVRHADELFWGQTYGADDFGARFLERYGWSEIIGERGPIPSHRIACGFLMLGPGRLIRSIVMRPRRSTSRSRAWRTGGVAAETGRSANPDFRSTILPGLHMRCGPGIRR